MNISNILTILRLILAFVIVFLLSFNNSAIFVYLALFLFLIAALSDYLDGMYARRKNMVTNFGKIMDPIADKLLIILTLGAFSFVGLIRLWMVFLIALREIVITLIRLRVLIKGEVLAAKEAGKFKTACQMGIILFLFSVVIFIKENPDFNYLNSLLCKIVDLIMFILIIITFSSAFSYLRALKNKG